MDRRPLGRDGPPVSPIGFGAFKIGRNEKIKYPAGYDLPSDDEAARLLNGVLDLGVNLIDTAPAYGLSEARVGAAISHRRDEFVLSTKVGETFEGGESAYDYSAEAIERSVERSLDRLGTDVIDVLLLHSDGRDLEILHESDAVPTLRRLREDGVARRVGLSGKTVEGARAALGWADVLMVEYHPADRSHGPVIEAAAERGVGVMVKKALGAGHLDPAESLRFVLGQRGVSAAVVGTLSLDHLRSNLEAAEEVR